MIHIKIHARWYQMGKQKKSPPNVTANTWPLTFGGLFHGFLLSTTMKNEKTDTLDDETTTRYGPRTWEKIPHRSLFSVTGSWLYMNRKARVNGDSKPNGKISQKRATLLCKVSGFEITIAAEGLQQHSTCGGVERHRKPVSLSSLQ
jgi:hypothetical protein